MDHGGPLVSVSLREAPSSLGRLVAASNSPPCLRTRTNEMIGGGDVHQSSSLPLFSGSIFACMLPRHPGFASEQKGTMTAWWYLQQEGQSLVETW